MAKGGISNKVKRLITPKLQALSQQIAKDQQLANNLYDAYQRRDSDYMQNLIVTSPFGSAYSKIKKEMTLNRESYDQEKAKIEERIRDNQNKLELGQGLLNQSSEDLINAGSALNQVNKRPNDLLVSTGRNSINGANSQQNINTLVNGGLK